MGGLGSNQRKIAVTSARRRDRSAVRGFVAFVAVVLVVASVATLAARLHWFLDLFSHFRWQFVLAAVIAAPLAWLCGMRTLAVGCAATLLVHLPALGMQRLGDALTTLPAIGDLAGVRTLRVVSFNVLYSSRAYAPLIAYVERTSPDVVCLYETTGDWKRQLAPLTEKFAFSLFAGDGPRTGLACMSRSAPLRVVPPPADVRAAPWLSFELDLGGQYVNVYGVHLAHPVSPTGAASHNRQLLALGRELGTSDRPAIVVGDFNMSPYSPFSSDFAAASKLRDCSSGRPLEPTWPTWFAPLWIQIDRCFVSPDVSVARYQVDPAIGSDHYPLLMDFTIERTDRTLAKAPRSIERPRPPATQGISQ